MNDVPDADGWREHSKHVLAELRRLHETTGEIKKDLDDIRKGLAKVSVIESDVQEVKKWRNNLSEVCSPTQLKESLKQLDDLKAFKSKAIAIFTFAQISLVILISIVAAVAGVVS